MPKVVGQTAAGEPVFEVRSVRLLLRENASHFSRIVTCSKCGRDAPGPPVLNPSELDLPPNPVICKECVREATAPAYAARPPVAPERRVSDAPLPRPAAGTPATRPAPAPDDPRLAVLERQVRELTALVHAQRTEPAAVVDGEDGARQAEVARLGEGAQQLADAQQALGRRLESVASERAAAERRFDEAVERLGERVEVAQSEFSLALEAGLKPLQAALDGQVDREQADVAQATREHGELVRDHARLVARLDGLAEHVERLPVVAPVTHEEVTQAVERAVAQQSELRAALDARVAQLENVRERDADRVGASVAELRLGTQELRRAQDELRQLVERVVDRQEELGAGVAASATVEERLATFEEQVSRRLDDVVEDAARTGAGIDAAVGRAEARQAELRAALDARIEQMEAAVAWASHGADAYVGPLEVLSEQLAALEAQRLTSEAASRSGLDEVRAAITAAAASTAGRFESLDEKGAARDLDIAELNELQAELDGGLGELRSGIAAGRGAVRKLADAVRELQERLDALLEAQSAPKLDEVRGPWLAKRPAESAAQIAALEATTEALVGEQHHLKAQIASLEQAAVAASRAPSQVSPFGPLRSDVRALQEQLAEQNDALAALARSVERLRRKIPTQPVAKRAPRAGKT